jgi:hypothetical protein
LIGNVFDGALVKWIGYRTNKPDLKWEEARFDIGLDLKWLKIKSPIILSIHADLLITNIPAQASTGLQRQVQVHQQLMQEL